MPQDCNGAPVVVGDRVLLHGTVKHISPESKTGCNVHVLVDNANESYRPWIAVNGQAVEIERTVERAKTAQAKTAQAAEAL